MVNTESPVFLFVGQNDYLKTKAIKKIESSVSGVFSRDLDYKVLYGAETDAAEILSYANTPPFLSSKRLVVVKNFEKLSKDDKARIIAYIEKPSKSTCLILDINDDSMLKEYTHMSRNANVKKFGDLTNSELFSWAKQFLSSANKKIDEEAIADLGKLQGQNLMALTQELEKLTAFIGDRAQIKESDVEELVGKSIEASSFDLGWAVERKDIAEAMRITSDLLMRGRRHQEIIGILCWHLKMLIKVKGLQVKGESDYCISGTLNIKRKYSDELCARARLMTGADLISRMEVLLESDLDIKRTRLDPDLLLEFAIIRLCLT